MNRDQFKKCIGQTLRLRPHAIGAQGESRDDDWTVELDADVDEVVLKHMGSGEGAVVGFDHVHSYMSDRARGKTHGFLQMLSQIRIAPDGTISAVPLPPRQAGIVRPTFNPLVVNDGTADRYLTWSARDPEHLIAHEGQPRQLYGTYTEICDALRTATGREPQFDRPNDIRHEIVWELTADHESKHKLLGGMDTKAGTAVLVLTDNPAKPPQRPKPTASSLPPVIEVVPYSGEEAILYIENTGGEAVFSADAQIVQVSAGNIIGHPAPYRMRWRDVDNHEVVNGHEVTIPSGGRVKLVLARWESGGDWGKPSLVIIGDGWAVDQYRHDPFERLSPIVTISIMVKSVPAAEHGATTKRCAVYIPANTIKRVVVEDKSSGEPVRG